MILTSTKEGEQSAHKDIARAGIVLFPKGTVNFFDRGIISDKRYPAVRYEPEQHQHLYRNLVHSRGNLSEEIHTKRETINMKSSEIIKETLHRADGVLYPVDGRKDKVLQKITGCGRNSKKQGI